MTSIRTAKLLSHYYVHWVSSSSSAEFDCSHTVCSKTPDVYYCYLDLLVLCSGYLEGNVLRILFSVCILYILTRVVVDTFGFHSFICIPVGNTTLPLLDLYLFIINFSKVLAAFII